MLRRGSRRIVNIDSLRAMLATNSSLQSAVKLIWPEDYTMAEQLRMVSTSAGIAALHGQALLLHLLHLV